MSLGLDRRAFLGLAGLGGLGLIGAACRGSEPPSTAGGSGAQPPRQEVRRLRMGFSGLFDITKLCYPVAMARLKEQGVEIEPVFLDSAVVTFKALIAGELDLAEGAVAAAIQANQANQGTDDRLRVFCAMNPVSDYVIVTVPEVTSLQGLLGRRFGVARLGSISHFVPSVVLQRSGYDPNAVEWIAVGGTAARRAAMYSGAIVGAVMHVEEALLARRDGYNLIYEAAALMPEYIANGLVAKDRFIQANPDLIQQITDAMIDAARWAMENRAGALDVAAQQNGSDGDPVLLGEAYDAMVRIQGWGMNGGLSADNMTATMQEELEMRTIDQPLPWEDWATLDYVNRYLARKGQYTK